MQCLVDLGEVQEQLHGCLRKALKTSDLRELNHIYSQVSELNHEIRDRCGLAPSSDLELEMLKCPQEQMQEHKVSHHSLMGKSVVDASAKLTPPKTEKGLHNSMFYRSFRSAVYANGFKDRVLQVCAYKLPEGQNKDLVLLPPLLMRADKEGCLRFECKGRHLFHTNDPQRTHLLLVFFAEGPILPVVRKPFLQQVRPKLHTWYSKRGRTDTIYFLENFV